MAYYDPYYQTRVNRKWGRLPFGFALGVILIIVGVLSVVWSIVDLARATTPFFGSAWTESSIWPTIGKGIWVGAIMVFTGIMGIISCKEGTQFSLIVFNISCWVTMLFSLFLILSSILHIEPYNASFLGDAQFRVPAQNLEIAMNSLLIGMGCIAFLTAFIGAILSCKIGGCCFNRRRRIIKNVPVYPTAPGAPYSIPLNVNTGYSYI